jgi:LuxR family maltose regulon positive regulatory protein
LDRLSAPLCDALVGQDDGSQSTLEHLDHANLFVVPLDASRLWYRYHHLFASLLRHRLETAARYDMAQLHRRASRWYADNGFPADAVGHALAAGDWDAAVDLILGGLEETMLKRGEMATLLGWYRALPDQVVRANPQLCMAYSWPLILTERIDDAEPYLRVAEQAARAAGAEGNPLLGEVTLARVQIARMRGDNRQALALSEQALALLPQDDLNSRSIVAVNLGIAQWFRGRLVEAEKALTEAERAGRGSGNDYARFAALTFLCRIQVARGHLRGAAARCRERIEQSGELTIGCLAHFDLSRLLYEWNDLDSAAEHLRQGIALARRGGSVEFLCGGTSSLALVEQARGNASAAQETLQRADDLAKDADISPPTRLANLAAHIAVALAQGDVTAAAAAVGQIPEPDQAGSFPDYLSLMLLRARFLLAAGPGQGADAAAQLAAVQGMAAQAGWQSVVVQARVLQALVASTPEEALAALDSALALAEPEGYIRSFVDTGEPMEALLVALCQGPSTANAAYANRLLEAFRAAPPSKLDRGRAPTDSDQPRDRLGALRFHQHGQDTPQKHLWQARGWQPAPGGRQGQRVGPSPAVRGCLRRSPSFPSPASSRITRLSPAAGDDISLPERYTGLNSTDTTAVRTRVTVSAQRRAGSRRAA